MIKRIIIFMICCGGIRADTYQSISDAKTRQFMARQAMLNNMKFRVGSNPIRRLSAPVQVTQQAQTHAPQPQSQQIQGQVPAQQVTQQQQPQQQQQLPQPQQPIQQQVASQHCPTCKQAMNVNTNNTVNNIIHNRQVGWAKRSLVKNRLSNKRYRRFK